MPIYDPAIRGGGGGLISTTGGQSTAAVPRPPNTANNDLIIVTGNVSTGVQINPPDGTWTRINAIVAGFQAFWKRANNEPASWTFTWDAVNRAYTFNSLAAYSQGGGTISLDTAAMSQVNPANSKTSDAVTPSVNALVLVSYLEFVVSEPGPPIGPGGLAQVQATGGIGAPSFWAGYIYVQGASSSGTFIASNNALDPSSTWFWGSGTFSLISSLVNTAQPPLLTDEAIFSPSTTAYSDILFRSCSGDTAFGVFSGAALNPLRPDGVQPGDLLIAHIWSDGTAPGEGAFLSTPVGWLPLPGTYLENRFSTPAASWLFYKVAGPTESDVVSYEWLLPRPTLNTWTVIVYAFVHVDPAHLFNGFKTATGGDGSPRAPGLTPDWRNDVSLLLFAEINPLGTGSWPPSPNAPPGYTLLCERQNQGEWQVGYLGTPDSCNPVPDVFAYTEAQQIAQLGSVRYRNAWFAYSLLLKNKNVVGKSCGPPPPPPPQYPGGMRDGNLVGFTFNEEQQVIAWHRHPLIGALETIACIPSPTGKQDELWMVVNRTINGVTRRYIEFMAPHFLTGDDLATQSLYSDSGGTYNGPPTRVITGMDRLEGQTVKVLTDGSRHPDRVVTGGQITLEWVASIVQWGLPQTCRLTTMPLEANVPNGTAQAKVKRIVDVTFRFLNTLGGRAGREDPDAELSDPPQTIMDGLEFRDPDDPMDEPLKVYNGLWPEETYAMNWPAGSEVEGCMTYVNDEPYPVTIVGIYPNFEIED